MTVRVGLKASQLLKNTSATWLTLVLSAGMVFGSRGLVAYWLGPRVLGIYALMIAATWLAATVISLGLPTYNASFASKQSPGVLLSNSILWCGTGFIGLTILFLPVLLLVQLPEQWLFVAVGIWFAPLSALLDCVRGIMLGREEIAAYNTVALLASFLNLALVSGQILTGQATLAGVVVAWGLSILIPVVVSIGLVLRKYRNDQRTDVRLMKSGLRFGVQAWLAQLTGVLNFRIGLFLVELQLGTQAVGVYAISTTLAELLFYFPNALASVTISRYAIASREQAAWMIARSYRAVLTISAVCGLALAIIAKPLIVRVFGSQYELASDALLALVPGIVVYTPAALTTWYFNAHVNKPSLNILTAATSLLIGAVLQLVLTPAWYLVGVGVANTIGYFIASVINILLLQRYSGLTLAAVLKWTVRDFEWLSPL